MNVDAIHTDNCTDLHATSMAVRVSEAGAYNSAEKPANGEDNLWLSGAWNDLTVIPARLPERALQQIFLAATPHRSARRQSLTPAISEPAALDATAASRCRARQRRAAKHSRSRRTAGRSVSVATLRRKTTITEGAAIPTEARDLPDRQIAIHVKGLSRFLNSASNVPHTERPSAPCRGAEKRNSMHSSRCFFSFASFALLLSLLTGCQQTPPAPIVVETPAPPAATGQPSTTIESSTTTRSSDVQTGDPNNPQAQSSSSTETTKNVKKTQQ